MELSRGEWQVFFDEPAALLFGIGFRTAQARGSRKRRPLSNNSFGSCVRARDGIVARLVGRGRRPAREHGGLARGHVARVRELRERDQGTTVPETRNGLVKTAEGSTDVAHFPRRIILAEDEPVPSGSNKSQTGIHVPYVRSGTGSVQEQSA